MNLDTFGERTTIDKARRDETLQASLRDAFGPVGVSVQALSPSLLGRTEGDAGGLSGPAALGAAPLATRGCLQWPARAGGSHCGG